MNGAIDGEDVGMKLVSWVVASAPLKPGVPRVEEMLEYHVADFSGESLKVAHWRR
jgi:hypothetical protein